ncbi:MAG: glycine betaine/L-proline transporter permease and substrate-binding protein [Phycisphaerales bacterium]|nr:glycine betaine/L-proline transporter permease and substrate-binding protein [Phycisphaerales bacterium]
MKCLIALLLLSIFAGAAIADTVHVGSKAFTESVVLAEVATQLSRSGGATVEHRSQLGGTRILWEALLRGEIDAYPEYTGTITQEILSGQTVHDDADLRRLLAERGIGMTRPLGFNDTYALGMLEATATKLNVRSITDLRTHADLRFGFSNEFLSRKDGWPAVRDRYALPQTNVSGLDHDLAYRAVAAAKTDLIDLYSTDAEIKAYGLCVLDDDQKLFPDYQAVYLYRLDLKQKSPALLAALQQVEGKIDAPHMIAMNARAKLDHVAEANVAKDFILEQFQTRTEANQTSLTGELWLRTKQHLLLVSISLAIAIAVAVPLGVAAFAFPKLGHVILGTVSAIYTIPSLALLALMIPLPYLGGIGNVPAITALFLYSLLPIVRNTHAGLAGIPTGLRESARVLGLPASARLWYVELPMAMPSILAGIQTAAVINVGTATIGALIGAGGYGQPILTGVRLADNRLILLGAIPAAAMALLVQGGFGLLGKLVIPRGLRIQARS